LNPNGKITGKYHLSIAYGNFCVILASSPTFRFDARLRRSRRLSLTRAGSAERIGAEGGA
jgi:hypothetical protein